MSFENVLLTGGNGVIGSAVLVALCEAGYHVHAVVRRQEAIDKTRAHPTIARFSSQIQWSTVPDITKANAFLEVVKGCHHIVHVASPLPAIPPRPEDLRTPALQGTQAILNAAESEPLVKRVVITSSVASTRDVSELFPSHPFNQPGADLPLKTGSSRIETPREKPADDALPFVRYNDSKSASANLVRDYAASHPDSHFEMVLLCPGWVLGPGLFIKDKVQALGTANGTLAWTMLDNRPILNPLYGVPEEDPTPLHGDTVWIGDVVLAHVRSLSVPLPSATNLQSWILVSNHPFGIKHEDAEEIIRRRLPDVARNLTFPGKVQTLPVNYEVSAERELLGQDFVPFEEQVVRSMEWLLQLPDGSLQVPI